MGLTNSKNATSRNETHDLSEKISDTFNKPTTLTFSSVSVLPNYVYSYTHLEQIRISGNVEFISESISNLVNLQTLDIFGCVNLTKLPDSIGKLLKLTSIHIERSGLTKLPDSLGDLVNLEKLIITNNKLYELPDTIGKLTNLSMLQLENNFLTKLPDSIGLLKNLRYLKLNHNSITQIPKSIGLLKNLQSLVFEYNNLVELPNEISELDNLTDLYLRGNKIIKIPNSLAQMKCLRKYHIPISSYAINELAPDLELLVIVGLQKELINLPYSLKKVMLFKSKKTKIKLPFGCELYIENQLVKQ